MGSIDSSITNVTDVHTCTTHHMNLISSMILVPASQFL
jgi:hypothetical protein